MKKIINLIICTLLFLLSMVSATDVVKALAPGETFSVSLACGDTEGVVAVIASNGTIQSGGNWCDRNTSITSSVVVGGEGTVTVQLVSRGAIGNASTSPVELPDGYVISKEFIGIGAKTRCS